MAHDGVFCQINIILTKTREASKILAPDILNTEGTLDFVTSQFQ